MHILIIDDDPEDTEIFCAALMEIRPQAVCTISHSCKELNVLLESLPVQDFVFVDGHMYPVSGRQCVMELLKSIDQQHTKVIIHTGSLSPTETVEFYKLGVNDIIRKAHGFKELKNTLERILSGDFSSTKEMNQNSKFRSLLL